MSTQPCARCGAHTPTETRHADGTVTVDEGAALDGCASRFLRAILGR